MEKPTVHDDYDNDDEVSVFGVKNDIDISTKNACRYLNHIYVSYIYTLCLLKCRKY